MDARNLRGLQQRLEESELGRAAISAFLAVTLLTLLAIQLPGSYIREQALRIGDPYSNALGLDQGWGVFAPNPRRQVIALEAKVTFADGTTRLWQPPRTGPVIGSYWDYRWRKYMEMIRSQSRSKLWPALAAFAAREVGGRERPVHVELTRRWYALLPPGAGLLRGPWNSQIFYTATGADLRRGESS